MENLNPENNDKQVNILCLISMACVFVPTIVSILFLSVWDALTTVRFDESSAGTLIGNIWSILATLLLIAGIALLIYVRVKYPENKFGKVLMWIYIALAILMIIAIIVIIIACSMAMITCGEGCASCLEECRKIDS